MIQNHIFEDEDNKIKRIYYLNKVTQNNIIREYEMDNPNFVAAVNRYKNMKSYDKTKIELEVI